MRRPDHLSAHGLSGIRRTRIRNIRNGRDDGQPQLIKNAAKPTNPVLQPVLWRSNGIQPAGKIQRTAVDLILTCIPGLAAVIGPRASEGSTMATAVPQTVADPSATPVKSP